jgi:hypothetical protein
VRWGAGVLVSVFVAFGSRFRTCNQPHCSKRTLCLLLAKSIVSSAACAHPPEKCRSCMCVCKQVRWRWQIWQVGAETPFAATTSSPSMLDGGPRPFGLVPDRIASVTLEREALVSFIRMVQAVNWLSKFGTGRYVGVPALEQFISSAFSRAAQVHFLNLRHQVGYGTVRCSSLWYSLLRYSSALRREGRRAGGVA